MHCTASPTHSRKLAKQKKLAAKREQELQEEDDAVEATAEYNTADLAGLQVLHDKDFLQEGSTILTLADSGVLDDDDDMLENVELAADDRRRKNEEKRKKGLDEYVDSFFCPSADHRPTHTHTHSTTPLPHNPTSDF
jgi:hypothetical protein